MVELTLGLGALTFFSYTESKVAAHRVTAKNISPHDPMTTNFDFAAPQMRPSLGYGWRGDESWSGGQRSMVWVTGPASEWVINLPTERDYHFRFDVVPDSPKRACLPKSRNQAQWVGRVNSVIGAWLARVSI